MAKALGITGLKFRTWLRAEKAAGHPLLAGHQYQGRWEFTRVDADHLMAEYRASGGRARPPGPGRHTAVPSTSASPAPEQATPAPVRPRSATQEPDGDSQPLAGHVLSAHPGHRVTTSWMDTEVVTLADLLRPGLRAVVIGINPSPVSVAAGHYYQGTLGQRFFAALTQAGVLPSGGEGSFEDDRAFAAGLGFTDLVKRPTSRAASLPTAELEHGRALLEDRLGQLQVPRVIFAFKKSATMLLGPFGGFGVIERRLADAEVFVMSGPMAPAEHRRRAIDQLRHWWPDSASVD